MTMLRLAASIVLPVVLATATLACGNPKPDAQTKSQKIEADAGEASPGRVVDDRRRLARGKPTPMPETFAGFPRPDLTKLEGVWIVDATPTNPGEVWAIESGGGELTVVDRRAKAEMFGIILSSPCALRLTDDDGRAQTRAIANDGDKLIISKKGAVAVGAPDGSLLACVGHRTYQLAPDGRCRYTTELLGAWSDPVEAKDACALTTVEGHRVLTIAGTPLHEQASGVWLDELAAAPTSVATPAASREDALAAITPPAKPEGGETGAGPEPKATTAMSSGETG